MAGEVHMTCQLGKEFLTRQERQQNYLLVEVVPSDVMAQVRMPVNMTFVIDHSGSMKGPKLDAVKDAVKAALAKMQPTDFISLVIFDDAVETVIPSQPANDPIGMQRAVDAIQPGGGTAMSLGMQHGLAEATRHGLHKNPNVINRIILLTDGVTYGDVLQCHQLARDAASAGIAIHPHGIGQDWDEVLLTELGQFSGGPMAPEFIRKAGEAITIFEQQMQSAVEVAVRNAVLTVDLQVPYVSPRKALKVLPTIADYGTSVLSDARITIPLGDLQKQVTQSSLFDLILSGYTAPNVYQIAVVHLTYDVPAMNLVGEHLQQNIQVTITDDQMKTRDANAKVMNLAERANAYLLVEQVKDEFKKTGRATTKLSANVTQKLDMETQEMVARMQQGANVTEDQLKAVSSKTRRLTQRLDNM